MCPSNTSELLIFPIYQHRQETRAGENICIGNLHLKSCPAEQNFFSRHLKSVSSSFTNPCENNPNVLQKQYRAQNSSLLPFLKTGSHLVKHIFHTFPIDWLKLLDYIWGVIFDRPQNWITLQKLWVASRCMYNPVYPAYPTPRNHPLVRPSVGILQFLPHLTRIHTREHVH